MHPLHISWSMKFHPYGWIPIGRIGSKVLGVRKCVKHWRVCVWVRCPNNREGSQWKTLSKVEWSQGRRKTGWAGNVLQWRNWLAHGTYNAVYVSDAGVVSSSLTWSILFCTFPHSLPNILDTYQPQLCILGAAPTLGENMGAPWHSLRRGITWKLGISEKVMSFYKVLNAFYDVWQK
jgi:hypothetical protein